MKKDITIDGKIYHFKSSAAMPRLYRMKFNRDIFVDMDRLQKNLKEQEKREEAERKKAEAEGIEYEETSSIPPESLIMFEDIAYLMNKHGDPSQPDDVNEWLDQFETFSIYAMLPQILELWNADNVTTSIPKKKGEK